MHVLYNTYMDILYFKNELNSIVSLFDDMYVICGQILV